MSLTARTQGLRWISSWVEGDSKSSPFESPVTHITSPVKGFSLNSSVERRAKPSSTAACSLDGGRLRDEDGEAEGEVDLIVSQPWVNWQENSPVRAFPQLYKKPHSPKPIRNRRRLYSPPLFMCPKRSFFSVTGKDPILFSTLSMQPIFYSHLNQTSWAKLTLPSSFLPAIANHTKVTTRATAFPRSSSPSESNATSNSNRESKACPLSLHTHHRSFPRFTVFNLQNPFQHSPFSPQDTKTPPLKLSTLVLSNNDGS